MDHIHYGFGGIATAADDIRTTSTSIGTLLSDLKARIEPMVATWDGDSAEAYQASQKQWDDAAAELNTILETIASAVSEGGATMSDINRRAAASWGG
ncbi:WXG100 family type VII secretion target [Corynebacterium sp. H113]|uniref:WXG100 family type VII secretion target n=1 Tax=Corynebacterium sp. H113 TaxID=3133419 RepID=UPI0030B45A56